MKKNDTYRLVATALLFAVGMVLPAVTGHIQAIAKIICPLHIPVLICGLVCGWKWGLGLGVLLPVVRGLLIGIPVFPTSALPMAFELGAYGLFAGLFYAAFLRLFKGSSHLPPIICALVISMILGRFIGGGAKALLLSLGVIGSSSPFTFAAFFSSYFVSTAPGALIHIIIIPAIVLALERARLSPFAGAEK